MFSWHYQQYKTENNPFDDREMVVNDIMEYYADIKTDVYKELVITWEHADVTK